jgi:hypothetical protein
LLARRDEVTAFSASETAQRRQEQERRAAEKAEAEAAKLRQEAAAAQQREREQQLTTLMDLNLQVCGYQTCLGYAWVAYCVQLLVCCGLAPLSFWTLRACMSTLCSITGQKGSSRRIAVVDWRLALHCSSEVLWMCIATPAA